ncbi:VWA domain-containing protein [Sanguibacter sp. Leaf3]|uniref:VWA domain-containing protein n=1 Tax=Sanguibacter sp. Leaf3 TaxID=1736209 RepID=UPI0006F939CD|nr:VWA domain-containing protein [Sanguibacter sp. Leaf3]KQT99582.1 stress protein [Sanguibacter sp. Leaf3]
MRLARGANTTLGSTDLSIAVSGAQTGTVDLMAFQLTDAGRVRGDHDLVFFNQPASVEGALRLVAGDRLTLSLAGVPQDVATVAVAVALDEGTSGSLAAIDGLGVSVQAGAETLECPVEGLTTERAVVLLEVYRRQGAWKLRNVSAGWDGGLADLVREHGVSVDDEVPEAVAPQVPVADTPQVPEATSAAAGPAPSQPVAPPPAQVHPPLTTSPTSPPPAPPAPAVPATPDGVRSVPGEQRLSFEKRQRLDLRKREVAKVLLTKGAPTARARVVMVIDKTGSMRRQYSTRVVHRVVERMIPVAIQLDDDGSLEAYLYGSSFARLPDVTVEQADEWSDTFLHLDGTHGGISYRRIGGYNDEIPIMSEVLSTLRQRDPMPTLVLFFTDGGFSQRGPITELVRQASGLPAFWQFVGIGRANYGLLTALDELEGRVVDNVGFFELDDIDAVADSELYARLLGEFPDWLRAAHAAGIVGG